MSALSPKSNKKLGYSTAGVTEVDKNILNAKNSLHSLLQRSLDRQSNENEPESPAQDFRHKTIDPKNILDEALIPNKDAEITKDVSRYRKQYVSPTYRSSFIPYSYNVTQRSGDYQE